MKTIKSVGEFGLIKLIARKAPQFSGVVKGVGDDAAVLEYSKTHYQLLTMDTIVEDVDFKKRGTDPALIGRKALAINLSDIAAMGGNPEAALVSLTLPKETPVSFVTRLYEGLRRLATEFEVSLVGGDISRGSKISITVMVLGQASKRHTVFRSGAGPGDVIGVTGALGGSILGHHFKFQPRVREGELLAKFQVSSMIDISDGLLQDLEHLMRSSKRCYTLDRNTIPISLAAKRLGRGNRAAALNHALCDGEDFELLFTVSPLKFESLKKEWKHTFATKLTRVGEVLKKKPAKQKHLASMPGFQHF